MTWSQKGSIRSVLVFLSTFLPTSYKGDWFLSSGGTVCLHFDSFSSCHSGGKPMDFCCHYCSSFSPSCPSPPPPSSSSSSSSSSSTSTNLPLLPLSFLSVTEAVVSRKLKGHQRHTCLCFNLLLNICAKIKQVCAAVDICACDTK